MDTPIAKFFATVKFVPDKASIRQTERIFNKMLFGNNPKTSTGTEKKSFADKFNSLLGGFKPNVSLIQKALDNSTRGRSKLTLQIDNFKVNKASLQKSIMQAAKGITFPITPKAVGGTPRIGSPSGFHGGASRFRITPSGVGLAAGGVGIFGGLGIGVLNQTVRTLQNLPVMLTSVTGSEQRAQQELQFLNNLGNQVGATVASMAPDYTKMFASAMGTPLESQMQRGFSAFTRYGKVMGLDQEAMSGSYRAITQMVSKQQIMAEELKGQLAERLPAAVRIMADAVTGGDTKKLFAMMEKGQLDPNTVLPKFFEELEARAAGGWDKYIQTSGYWQNMTGKRLEDLVKLFAANGGNEAFVRIWKTFAETLKDLDGITILTTKAFVGFSKVLQETGDIIRWVDTWVEKFNSLSPNMQTGIELLAGAFILLRTNIGRAMVPFLAIYMIMSDLQSFFNGEDSLIGRIVNGTADLTDGIIALGTALAGLSIFKGLLSVLGYGGDSDKKDTGKPKGGRFGVGGLVKGGIVGALGYTAYDAVTSGFSLFQAKGDQLKSEGTAAKMQALYSQRLAQMTPEQIAALNDPAITADYNSRNSILTRPNGYSTNNTNQFEINISTPSTDPTTHANIVVDIINKSLPFYAVGEGAG